MKTYKVTAYRGGAYTVSLDDSGVVDVNGLLPDAANNLKWSVRRNMDRRGLSPIVALGLVAGSYSTVSEVDIASVSDQTPSVEVP